MNEQPTLISRIGNWFKRGGARGANGELPLEGHISGDGTAIEPRSTFLRPWAKQERAISILQEGVGSLTDIMASVRENLERQSQRQDELLRYLSHLPQAIEAIPESNRVQSETLKAIHQQLEQQNVQQRQLGSILEKISETGGDQREILDGLRERVETLNEYDQQISENMHSVGAAMQSVSRSSQSSTEVLQQIRDNMHSRDSEIEKVLHRQGVRFTTLLAIAVFLSIAALVAVSVIGYLLLTRP